MKLTMWLARAIGMAYLKIQRLHGVQQHLQTANPQTDIICWHGCRLGIQAYQQSRILHTYLLTNPDIEFPVEESES